MSKKWVKNVTTGAGMFAVASMSALLSTACGGGSTEESTTPAPTNAAPVKTDTTTAAAPAAKTNRLFIDVDTVRGSKNLTKEDNAVIGCVQSSQFAKNEQIVFRFRVFDPDTGKEMDDKTMSKIIVKFKNGTELPAAAYGAHPKEPPNESFWTAAYVIPPDFPAGSIDYTVTATDKEGRVGTFTPVHFAANALLTVTNQVRPIIPATPTPAAPAKQ
ncbi:MAG: hypothetical protein WC273_07545 [Dehalococcoidia bacterium]